MSGSCVAAQGQEQIRGSAAHRGGEMPLEVDGNVKETTLKSHALGCYISKNFYGTGGEGQRTLVLCKSFC